VTLDGWRPGQERLLADRRRGRNRHHRRHFEGTILSKTMIAMKTKASINGRLLAQTAVTLQMNAITQPAL
jgi:hypothetical protein